MRILVVEDEQALNELLVKQLQAGITAWTGALLAATRWITCWGRNMTPWCWDIMLPGVRPGGAAAHARQGRPHAGDLLTAKDGIEDRVTGLMPVRTIIW